MTTVLGSLSELATSLFQSFRLSYVIPAFVFWTLNALFILPNIPLDARNFLAHLSQPFMLQPVALLSILSVLGGYFLYVLNTPIIRLFEGYPWRESRIGEKKIEWHRRRRQELDENHQTVLLRRQLARLQDKAKQIGQQLGVDDPRRVKLQEELAQVETDLAVALIVHARNLKISYPTSKPPYLPTRLGNVIASFEDYPQTQYRIDAVTLWSRLVPILNREKYSLYIEREKANMDFLLNMCLISVIFCAELILTGYLFGRDIWGWVIITGYTLAIAYFIFYKTSITGALGWGSTVRVAFDLYRYQLLAALYGKSPDDFSSERDTWLNISEFYSIQRAESPKPMIDYTKVRVTVSAPSQPNPESPKQTSEITQQTTESPQ